MLWIDRVYRYGRYILGGTFLTLFLVGLATTPMNGKGGFFRSPVSLVLFGITIFWLGVYQVVFCDRLTREHYDRLARIWARHPGIVGRLLTMGNYSSPGMHRIMLAVGGIFGLVLSMLFMGIGLVHSIR